MVPQKNNDTVHDFENDPIETYIDGDWVKAKGTTLGADDGMGVAAVSYTHLRMVFPASSSGVSCASIVFNFSMIAFF